MKRSLKFTKFLNKLATSSRYFVVYYFATHTSGKATGQLTVEISGWRPFINRAQLVDFIERNSDGLSDVVLTGFYELSAREYEKFTADYDAEK